eukprot:gene8373-7680_t
MAAKATGAATVNATTAAEAAAAAAAGVPAPASGRQLVEALDQ